MEVRPERASRQAKHGFVARQKAEESAKWDALGNEREARQQPVLDRIAATFEKMSGSFASRIEKDFEILHTLDVDDERRDDTENRLLKLFSNMDAVDKFFRMYLRARGLPEKISRNLQEVTDIPLGYGDLESSCQWQRRRRRRRRWRSNHEQRSLGGIQ